MANSKWPSAVFYTDKLPEGVGGDAHGPVVRIRPKYRSDEGIHRHELEHVQQWWVVSLVSVVLLAVVFGMSMMVLSAIGVHSLLYMLVRPYRQWAEVRAYRIQMRYPNASGVPLSLDSAALRLTNVRYKFGLTVEQAKQLLS